MRILCLRKSVFAGCGIAALGVIASSAFAAPATATFTGSTVLSAETVTATGEGVTAPAPVYPELDAPTATDISNGFEISGRFDFLNGTGTSAEVKFTASRAVTLTAGSLYTTASEDGQFGIESSDVSGIPDTDAAISAADVADPVTATLTSFSTITDLIRLTSVVDTAPSKAFDNSGGTIPLTLDDFPTNSLQSTAGPVSSNTVNVVAGDYELEQSVDIVISDLLPGESVDILLPTTSTIGGATGGTSVPEPMSVGMLTMVGGVLAMRRRAR